nr:immunoglobulin heavy chain IgZ [Carassius auratus indigentiaus]
MISSSLWLLLLLAAVSHVQCVELTQTGSMLLSPGQVLTLSCKLSGYTVSDSSYCTGFIRQPAGKALEWVGLICSDGSTYYSDKLKSRFQVTRDSSINTVTLQGQNMQTEDTSAYYCARYNAGYFDYWGKGTKVTVSSAQSSAPKSIFAMSQCTPDSAGYVTVGCMARGFAPEDSLTFKWTDKTQKELSDFVQYPAFGSGGQYTKISHIRVKKSDLDPKKPYKCEASNSNGKLVSDITAPSPPPDQRATVYLTVPTKTELENETATFMCLARRFSPNIYTFEWSLNGQKVTHVIDKYEKSEKNGSVTEYSATSILQIKAEEWKKSESKVKCKFVHKAENEEIEAEYAAQFALTLKPPIQSELFVKQIVVLEAVVSGDVENAVKEAVVSCDMNAALTPGEVEFSKDISQFIKKHKVTVDKKKWFDGEKVTCTISEKKIKEVIHFNKGGEQNPTVHIYRPDYNKINHVSLVCEVNSPKLGDVYVMWKVGDESYREGTTSASTHQKDSTSVFSILTMTKEEYEKPSTTITCAVIHAYIDNGSPPLQVTTSKSKLGEVSCD